VGKGGRDKKRGKKNRYRVGLFAGLFGLGRA